MFLTCCAIQLDILKQIKHVLQSILNDFQTKYSVKSLDSEKLTEKLDNHYEGYGDNAKSGNYPI